MKPRRQAAETVFEGYDLRIIQRRFQSANAARLERTLEVLRPRQREFMDLLPLLFHVDDPRLPGYLEGGSPAGVADYTPDERTLELARRTARVFRYQAPAGAPPIWGLYCMGSAGSVAFTPDSDLDIWLCHDPGLDPAALARLDTKAEAIAAWAATLGLEVHFFPLDVERFARGEPMGLSSESSGTAQLRLLLDEFYRTGILVAGRYPLWWLVPPEREQEYEAIAGGLRERAFCGLGEPLDFGGLPGIPPEEFFGAALWQLSKGIEAPYKSVLKLVLIEAYAAEYPHMALLSGGFKRAVYGGDPGFEDHDPYLAMLDKVEGFLERPNEGQRLNIARRCFYIKTGVELSDQLRGAGDWRRRTVAERVQRWGWSHTELSALDGRDRWPLARMAEERYLLFEALTRSYRFLSDFARRFPGESFISQRDLTVLGRELYAAFERKAGKLELVNRGDIGRDMRDDHYTLQEVEERGVVVWRLFQGALAPEALKRAQPIKRSRGLVELLAWAWFNRVLGKRTAVSVYPLDGNFAGVPLSSLLHQLDTHVPVELLERGGIEDFARPASPLRSVLYLNVGLSARERAPLLRAEDANGRNDPLCFGPRKDNLVRSVDSVQLTSWQEVLSRRYAGDNALFDWLVEYLKWWPEGSTEFPRAPVVAEPTPYRGGSAHRVEALFGDVAECFYGPRARPGAFYVLARGDGLVVLSRGEEALGYRALDGESALLQLLERPHAGYRPAVFDRHATEDSPLACLYRRHRPGVVQFSFLPRGDEVEIFVVDERGSLFRQSRPFYSAAALLSHYSAFYATVLNRLSLLLQEDAAGGAPPSGFELYALEQDADGRYVSVPQQSPAEGEVPHLSVQALADSDEQGRTVFTLYCDGREFSNLEYGPGLFRAVAEYVLERRASGESYPIYITDLSLSRSLLGEGGMRKLQSLHFFRYKQRIEDQINRTLERVPRPAGESG